MANLYNPFKELYYSSNDPFALKALDAVKSAFFYYIGRHFTISGFQKLKDVINNISRPICL